MRCHFIQKLETQPSIEFSCMHPFYNELRKDDMNLKYYEAWKEADGLSFYRCLHEKFKLQWMDYSRMRAML